MPDVRRALRTLNDHWQHRPVQVAAMLALLMALGGAPLLPFTDAPGTKADQPVARARAIPTGRLTGPAALPKPRVGDQETKAVLAAARTVGPIRHGGSTRRLVALTFDDGPGVYTGQVLAVLRRLHVPATFFQVGKNLDDNPDPATATRLLDHVSIGDHTYTHHSLLGMTRGQQRDEIIATNASMLAHGEPTPRLFRPPYGSFNQDTEKLLAARGMALILWSVDSQDYARPGVDQIVQNVLGAVEPGSIVLMHDGGGDRSQTAAALPRIVKGLRRRGYGLVTVPALLLKDPPRKEDQHVATPPPGARKGAG